MNESITVCLYSRMNLYSPFYHSWVQIKKAPNGYFSNFNFFVPSEL